MLVVVRMRTVVLRQKRDGSQNRRERFWTAAGLAPERAARRGEAQDEPNHSPTSTNIKPKARFAGLFLLS